MTLMHYNPMDAKMRRFGRFFDEFFGERDQDGEVVERVWMPRVDIVEAEHDFRLVADLPGMKKEDVNIVLEEGVLTISGERPETELGKDESCHLGERAHGKFSRRFTVRDTIDVEKISAEFNNGVLTVRLPKAEVAKPKKIEIKAS